MTSLLPLDTSVVSTVKQQVLQKDRISVLIAPLHKIILGFTDFTSFNNLRSVSRTFKKYTYNDLLRQTRKTSLKTLLAYFQKSLKKDITAGEFVKEMNKFLKENETLLEHLDLSWPYGFRISLDWPEGFQFFDLFTHIFNDRSYPHLRTLIIQGTAHTTFQHSGERRYYGDDQTPEMVKLLVRACPNLTDLKVTDFKLGVLKEFVLQCENLTKIEIINTQFYDQNLVDELNRHKTLTAVSLDFDKFNVEDLVPLLPNIKNLTSLRIRNTHQFLDSLNKCVRLQKLSLVGTLITDKELIYTLPALKELTHLEIISCGYITSMFFSVLPTLPKFQKLTLVYWKAVTVVRGRPSEIFNLKDIDHLAKCPNLEEIEIRECDGVTEAEKMQLQTIPSLKKLIIKEKPQL